MSVIYIIHYCRLPAGLTLGHLIGLLETFFHNIGIKKVDLKSLSFIYVQTRLPTCNPILQPVFLRAIPFLGVCDRLQLRFKPAYNPYTEPSMEVFGFHPGQLHGLSVL